MILINSSSKNALRIFQPFLPIAVPVAIGCLVSTAEREGIRIRFIDEQVEDNILGLVAKYVKEMERPYIFGFSVLTAALKNAIVLSRDLKRIYPDSLIVFGGIHPSAMPDEILSYKHIDVVIRGEAEKSLIDFYRCVKTKKDFRYLPGISYRDNGRIMHNPRSPIIDDLDSLPCFPYHIFTSKRYDLGFVVSSRGCPYECIFCSNRVTTEKRYRFKSAQLVLDDLVLLSEQYKKKHIVFHDDNFLVDKERIYQLIEGIKKKNLHKKMTFSFQARGDNTNYRLLKELYDSGFTSVFFGIETASDKIMKLIKKNETVAQCIEAVRLAKKIGFHISATFIYGLPQDSHSHRMDCLKLSNELKLDMVRYNNATPYPGTELYAIAKGQDRLKVEGCYENFVAVGTFIENPFKRMPLAYIPEGNSETEIRRDVLFSFFGFYFNVHRLKTVFLDPEQGVGWFTVGNTWLNILKKIPAIIVLLFMLLCKFLQLFYYAVIKKETRIPLRDFFKMFNLSKILEKRR